MYPRRCGIEAIATVAPRKVYSSHSEIVGKSQGLSSRPQGGCSLWRPGGLLAGPAPNPHRPQWEVWWRVLGRKKNCRLAPGYHLLSPPPGEWGPGVPLALRKAQRGPTIQRNILKGGATAGGSVQGLTRGNNVLKKEENIITVKTNKLSVEVSSN